MAAVAVNTPEFRRMSEAQLREWVEASPERANDKDSNGLTPLHAAVTKLKSLPLILWLIDEKGADVDGRIGMESPCSRIRRHSHRLAG